MLYDLRHVLRSLLRRSGESIVAAVLVMAVGIAATTAVFSVVDLLLFRNLPYPDGDQLVSLGLSHPILEGEFLLANDYLHLREQLPSVLTAVTSLTGVGDCDLTESNPIRLSCAQVESTFLRTFGVAPLAGRGFTEEEDRENAPKVALISRGLWQSRFGGEQRSLESTISVDGAPIRVIGVLPENFEMPNLQHVDILVPQALRILRYTPGESGRPLRVFGRLAAGVAPEQARSGLQPFGEEFIRMVPAQARSATRFLVRSVRDFQIQNVKLASYALFGTTLAILFLVCANVATLLLARAEARQKEFAMRRALGASRWRLIRLALTESLLLSLVAGMLGCALAWALLRLVQSLAPASIPRIQQAALDGRILAFALVCTVLAGLLSGLAPALTGLNLEALSGWRTVSSTRYSLRRILVVTQIAVSLILLAAAGFLVESWNRLASTHSGLAAENVITADITVGTQRYPNAAARQQFFNTLASRLRAHSFVGGVAISDTVPPSGFIHNRPIFGLEIPGRAAVEGSGIVDWRTVSPDYFSVLGIPILRGCTFLSDEQDPIILSQKLAAKLFPNEEPIGRTVRFRPNGPNATVVGIAGDVDNAGIPGQSDPEYYVPRRAITDQNAGAGATLINRTLHAYDGEAFVTIRTAAPVETATNWIRSDLAALDPAVPATITTMRQRLGAVTSRPRFQAALMTAFGLIGLVLAASGLYGLISYLVARRTQEIGVRLALGAKSKHIIALVARDALSWCAFGIGLGLVGAIVMSRVLQSVIAEIGHESLFPALTAAAITLMVVAIAAAAKPAIQAARIDPVQAIRHE